jgi:hypothetical protein
VIPIFTYGRYGRYGRARQGAGSRVPYLCHTSPRYGTVAERSDCERSGRLGATTGERKMISDVLHEAVAEMDKYLYSPEWRDAYTGQTREELKVLRNMMNAARQRLDSPPVLILIDGKGVP